MNAGEHVEAEEILAAHPELAADLAVALEGLEALPPSTGDSNEPLGTLGDYTLRRRIGRGGMGMVYDAWQNSLDRQVALKLLPVGVAADTKSSTRFLREAQIAARLSHPQIVRVHASGVEGGTPWYAMEFVEGKTLAQILATWKDADPQGETPFGPKDDIRFFGAIAAAFADVADGLQHAHSRGVIHRDVKPSNLILDAQGRLRILDFGLAHLEGQESLTLSGDVVGTPSYMSPEQARRRKIPVDHRTDVYSLGATMYEALTRQPPFRGHDHQDTLSQIITRDPLSPRRLNPRIPKDLETILLKCLRKEPGDRYGTAEALGQDLRRLVRGDAIEARPQGRAEKLARRAARHKGKVGVSAALLVLLIAVAWLGWRDHREAAARIEREYEPRVLAAAQMLQVCSLTRRAEVWGPVAVEPRGFVLGRGHPRELMGEARLDPVVVAVEKLSEIDATLPGRPDCLYWRSLGLLLLGREQEALKDLERARARDPGFVPAFVIAAAIAERRGDKTSASSLRSQAQDIARDGWRGAWLLAHDAWRGWRWREAADAYGRLLAVREPYVGCSLESRMRRAAALIEARDLAGALIEVGKAELLWPDSPEPALLEGKARYVLGRKEEAGDLFEEVFAGTLYKDEVALAVYGIYEFFEDHGRALPWTARIGVEYTREFSRCFSLASNGRLPEAVEAGKRAMAAYSKDPLVHHALANAYGALGLREEARRLLDEAIRLRPDDGLLHAYLGQWLRHAGQGREALESFRRGLALEPGCSSIQGLVGLCHLDLGERKSALDCFEAALRMDSGDHYTPVNVGEGLARLGTLKEALEHVERSLFLVPDFSCAFSLRGDVLARQGKLEEAVAEHRKASGGLPKRAVHLRALATSLERAGKLGEAFSAYCTFLETDPTDTEALARARALLSRRGLEIVPADADRLVATLDRALYENPDNVQVLKTLLAAQSRKSGDDPRPEYLSRLPAFAMIDAALASGECLSPENEARLLGNLRVDDGDADAKSRLTYLEALLLERKGAYQQAADRLARLTANGSAPEPFVTRARCLRAAGDSTAGERELRAALHRGVAGTRELWDLWLAISFVELKRTPRELLTEAALNQAGGYAEDVRWLLERLDAHDPLRIDCGAEHQPATSGTGWSQDRFARSGMTSSFCGDIAGTKDALPYQTARRFLEDDPTRSAYAVPLPPSEYQVTLHFVETYFQAAGLRRFDVLVEGEIVATSFDPFSSGFATAVTETFTAAVTDGVLDIGFVHRVGNPVIAAIEIQRLEAR